MKVEAMHVMFVGYLYDLKTLSEFLYELSHYPLPGWCTHRHEEIKANLAVNWEGSHGWQIKLMCKEESKSWLAQWMRKYWRRFVKKFYIKTEKQVFEEKVGHSSIIDALQQGTDIPKSRKFRYLPDKQEAHLYMQGTCVYCLFRKKVKLEGFVNDIRKRFGDETRVLIHTGLTVQPIVDKEADWNCRSSMIQMDGVGWINTSKK